MGAMTTIKEVFDKTIGAAGLQRRSIAPPGPGDPYFFRTLRQVLGSMGVGAVKPYIQSTWVYSSVNAIAQNIANVPFKLYQKVDGDDRDKEEVTSHDLIDLLSNPNPYMTGAQLIEATNIFMGLRGEAIWVLENRENVTQMPERIWCFDPARFEPVKDRTTGMVIGWKYQGLKTYVFGLHEILHFKYFNPYDDIRGLAPLEAARAGIDQDFFANKFNMQFFKEGAAISGFVEVGGKMNDKSYNRFSNYLNEKHSGYDKAHKIGILEGGATFKETKLTQRDMEFIKGKKITREEIFAVYKTNSVVLGLYEDIKSYEGIKTAHKAFWQECLIPKTNYQKTVINSKFIGPITGGKMWGEFDLATVNALQEDFSDKVEAAKGLQILGYPANMINRRMELGMDNIPWGDAWFHPFNLVSTDDSEGGNGEGTKSLTVDDIIKLDNHMYKEYGIKMIAPGKKGIKDTEEVTEIEENKTAGYDTAEKLLLELKGERAVEALTEEEKKKQIEEEELNEKLWRDFLSTQRPVEKKFLKEVRGYFFKQRKRVLEALSDYFGNKSMEEIQGEVLNEVASLRRDLTDDILDDHGEEALLRKVLTPLYSLAIKTGVEDLATTLGDIDFVFEPINPSYLGHMEMRLTRIPPKMVNTIKIQLRETLVEAIGLGESTAQMADRVREVYRIASSRALTIARTESAAAISSGRFEYTKEKGYRHHKWITAGDENERSNHHNMRNSIANVGDKFKFTLGPNTGSFTTLRYPSDMSAPAGEVINCRCVAIPVVEEI
jgi:HK97 family phage portal protein